MKVDDHFYDDLELFISYRAVIITCNLQQIKTCGMVRDLEGIRELYYRIVSAEDVLKAMTHR